MTYSKKDDDNDEVRGYKHAYHSMESHLKFDSTNLDVRELFLSEFPIYLWLYEMKNKKDRLGSDQSNNIEISLNFTTNRLVFFLCGTQMVTHNSKLVKESERAQENLGKSNPPERLAFFH